MNYSTPRALTVRGNFDKLSARNTQVFTTEPKYKQNYNEITGGFLIMTKKAIAPTVNDKTLRSMLKDYLYLHLLRRKKGEKQMRLKDLDKDFVFIVDKIPELQKLFVSFGDQVAWNPKYPYQVREYCSCPITHIPTRQYNITDSIAQEIGKLIRITVNTELGIKEKQYLDSLVMEAIEKMYDEDIVKVGDLM